MHALSRLHISSDTGSESSLRDHARWVALHTFEAVAIVQADRDGEGSPTESCMSMDSIPMRKRSRKPKHVYNAANVAPPQAPWRMSVYKPVKKVPFCSNKAWWNRTQKLI